MTLRAYLTDQLVGYPADHVAAVLAELTTAGPADKEIAELTVRDIRTTAGIMNIPAETIAELLVEQRCRVCGCTDDEPCAINPDENCHWIADDLCSACQGATIQQVKRPAIIVVTGTAPIPSTFNPKTA